MTDVASDLIASATRSLALAGDHPIEARRTVSSSYYAVYHALAQAFADALIGRDEASRPQRAWVEAYRGLDHATCLTACKLAINKKVAFPEPLMNVAEEFEQLQRARHTADYDPRDGLDATKAGVWLKLAKDCVDAIKGTPENDILAFATWVLISAKGAKDARASVYPSAPLPAEPLKLPVRGNKTWREKRKRK